MAPKMPLSPALLAATALLLAGCLGGPAPEAAQAPGAGPSPGGGSEGAPPATGSASGAGNASGEGAAEAAVEAERVEPISWDGTFGTWACVPTGPGSCSSFVGFGEHATTLEFPSAPAELQAELTWDARPGMERLAFRLSVATSCGDDCWSYEAVASVEGPSPLTLAVDDIAAAENGTIVLSVGSPNRAPPPFFLLLNVEQSFHVEGTATYRG